MLYKEFHGKKISCLGLGCMRFPMNGEVVDVGAVMEMVDYFMDAGFNYFDTARPYHWYLSEKALKTCLADRYDRSAFLLADKLSPTFFEKEEEL